MAQLSLGDLVVELSAENLKLKAKVDEAEGKLKGFEKTTSTVTDKAAASISRFTMAASAALIGLGYVIQSTINAAEMMGQKAQALGIASEELGKLQFAASQANIEVGNLQQGLVLLSNKMNDRDAMSEGVRTFEALGISVHDAAGQMKSSGAVFMELADKFAHMQDSAAKTQLAVSLFGRAGAELIPLLNQGSQAIKEMGDQGVALGAVFDQELITRSSMFNDTLDSLGAIFGGLINRLTKEVLPVLQYLATSVEQNTTLHNAFKITVDALAAGFKGLVATGLIVVEAFKTVGKAIYAVGKALADFVQGDWANAWADIKDGGQDIANSWGQLSTDLQTHFGEWAPIVTQAAVEYKKSAVPIIKTTQELQDAIKQLHLEHQYAFQDIMNSPTMEASAKIEALNKMVRDGAISWREYDAAVKSVNESHKQNMDSLVSATANALTTIFGKSKTAAIAAALINTYQGITKALAELPPPFSYGMAAITAAMGMAQIAKIRSTSHNSSGGTVSAPSGGGSSAAAAPSAAPVHQAPQTASQGQTLFVSGINPNSFFTGDVVRNLATKLIDYQRDGGKVVLTPS